jgi:Leucine-rich repeat (LRR) protein
MDKCNLGNEAFLMNPFRKTFDNLKVLSLAKNQISSLYWIRGFPKLEELNLSWNQISDLRENLFDYSTNLRNLILYKNKINFINLHSFKGLGQLEELDLRYNEIMSIQSNDFKSLCNLKVLLLNGNVDLTVNKAFLKYLKNLEHLFINSSYELNDFVLNLNGNISLHEDFFFSNQACLNNEFKLEKEGNELFQ